MSRLFVSPRETEVLLLPQVQSLRQTRVAISSSIIREEREAEAGLQLRQNATTFAKDIAAGVTGNESK